MDFKVYIKGVKDGKMSKNEDYKFRLYQAWHDNKIIEKEHDTIMKSQRKGMTRQEN